MQPCPGELTTTAASPEVLARRSFLFEWLHESAVVLDHRGVIVDTNRAWCLHGARYGGSPDAIGLGADYLDVCDRAAATGLDDAAAAAQGIRAVLAGRRARFDLDYRCSSPIEEQWFMLSACAIPLGDERGAVVFHTDITARKALETRLRAEARYDDLTGLHNRRSVMEFVQRSASVADDRREPVAVLVVDLDGFKAVNDEHGHHAGDALLTRVAARASGVVRRSDVVARLGGDEFLVVCPGADQAQADALAARLADVIRQPYLIGTRTVTVDASIGVVIREPGVDVDAALAQADQRMYACKAARRRHRRTEPA